PRTAPPTPAPAAPSPAPVAARTAAASPAAAPPTRVLPEREPDLEPAPDRRDRYSAPSVVLDDEPVEEWTAWDDDGRPPRRPRLRRARTARDPDRRRGSLLPRLVAVFALLLAAGALYFVNAVFQPLHSGPSSKRVTVTVPRGISTDGVGKLLAEKKVVASATFFRLRARISGKGEDIKPGTYRLQERLSYGAALDALAKGPPPIPVGDVTITEGRTRREASALLAKTSLKGNYYALTGTSPLLRPQQYGAPKNIKSLEGFLFPSTYEVRERGNVRELINKQLTTFKQRFAAVDLTAARKAKLTPYDVLIVASMVEREAALDKDRPLIASVIYNRLRQSEPLGIDATIRYALNDNTRPLTESDLAIQSPYNTRTNQGLPPTPIGNPGIESIRAAANPAKTQFLFFVVKPGTCGQHAFSRTLEEFNRDAERYNEARAAKGNRSPVKC
ncbi:MAG: endolytic transglycosylase MltG, partial [Solirubrobacteraceae bacterium]